MRERESRELYPYAQILSDCERLQSRSNIGTNSIFRFIDINLRGIYTCIEDITTMYK